MPHFAPLMISRAYACVAKSFASLREMNPSASPGSARRRPPKNAVCDPRDGIARLCGSEGADDGPKWRRKRLRLFKTGSKMAPRLAELRVSCNSRGIVIARSEATKQSNQRRRMGCFAPLAMTLVVRPKCNLH
jgi:hypothetical protein